MRSEEIIVQFLKACAETYPRRGPVTEELAGLYLELLAIFDPAALSYAFRRCLEECTFFPSPAEVRERALVRDPEPGRERIEARREQLAAAYKHRLLTAGRPPLLKSALDDAVAAELAPPPREVRALTPPEWDARVAELRRQAEQLGAFEEKHAS